MFSRTATTRYIERCSLTSASDHGRTSFFEGELLSVELDILNVVGVKCVGVKCVDVYVVDV